MKFLLSADLRLGQPDGVPIVLDPTDYEPTVVALQEEITKALEDADLDLWKMMDAQLKETELARQEQVTVDMHFISIVRATVGSFHRPGAYVLSNNRSVRQRSSKGRHGSC